MCVCVCMYVCVLYFFFLRLSFLDMQTVFDLQTPVICFKFYSLIQIKCYSRLLST